MRDEPEDHDVHDGPSPGRDRAGGGASQDEPGAASETSSGKQDPDGDDRMPQETAGDEGPVPDETPGDGGN